MQQSGRLLVTLAAAGLLAGCAAQPADYRSARETPEGPGMFSGEDGRLLLFSDSVSEGPDGQPLLGGSADGGEAAEPAEADAEAFREFRAFQAYQRWKEQAQGTGEYGEFREWLRWRQYQQWQEEDATR